MRLTPFETLGIILAVAAGTQITRWLPFWLFPENKRPPAWVTDLGKVLPAATMGLLVVYCLKDVAWSAAPHGAPELLAIFAVAALHRWKGNVLLHRRRDSAVHGAGAVRICLTHNFSSLRTEWRGGCAATSSGRRLVL